MRMSAADQARFPKATKYLKNDLPKVGTNKSIIKAVKTTGQLNEADFRMALNWGTSPQINVVRGLGACGKFKQTPGNNIIRIDEQLFLDYEAGRGKRVARAGNVQALGVTVLHELVHWADNKDGVDRPGEEGNEFERLVYGSVIPC